MPEALSEFQQRRKEEIERVCSRYYAEFLGCVSGAHSRQCDAAEARNTGTDPPYQSINN